jgi:hypothetical protein
VFAHRAEIELQQGFLLFALMAVLFADRDHLAQHLGVIAEGLGLGVDFLDVRGQGRFFLIQTLNTRDELLKLLARGAADGVAFVFFRGRGEFGHGGVSGLV